MNIIELRVADVIPYENNPRKNDDAVDAVAASIKEFGFKVPIVVDKENVIIAGHTRLKAAKKLGLEVVPAILADDLSEEQVKAFRLADNKTAELAKWDFDKLEEELADIEGIDMEQFGFSDLEEEMEKDEEPTAYSTEVKIPQYEPQEPETNIEACYDDSKTAELLAEIEEADVPGEIKDFLRLAAYRHTVFNFKNIANYYAWADEKVQRLMENSALVIIDMNDALAKGWVKLTDTIESLLDMEE